jgi:hypothetical protein
MQRISLLTANGLTALSDLLELMRDPSSLSHQLPRSSREREESVAREPCTSLRMRSISTALISKSIDPVE